MTDHELANQHAERASQLLDEIDTQLGKAFRKIGLEAGAKGSIAGAHATLAVFHAQRAASSS
jgi:hypothetical protein